MSKVAVTKQLLDDLADAISAKTETPTPLSIEDMTDAIDGLAKRYVADVQVNRNNVIIPSGLYPDELVMSVQGGLAGTPTAAKGAVSNHSVSVTPSVTNITGYIDGGTKTGTPVTVTASELDSGTKAINANGTGIDVVGYATVDVSVPASAPTIESLSVTPSETQQTYNSSSVDGYKPVTVGAVSSTYVGSGITRRSSSDMTASGATVTAPAGYYASAASKTIPNASWGENTESISKEDDQYIYERSYPNFSAGYMGSMDSFYVSLDLEDKSVTPSTSQQIVTPTDNNSYLNSVTVAAMPSGTAGTPTATKGAVSNHAVTVTPSVTNSTGYITGGTKTGTAVSVSASELVSGNLAITENGTNIDVTNYSTVSVAVEGGGGSGVQVDKVIGGPYESSTLTFTGLKGEPIAYYVSIDSNVSTGATAKAVALVYDGTTIHGETVANQITYSNAFTHSYSNGTLTITGTGVSFQTDEHVLVYAYGGSSANIETKDVQVGSGATSITFTGLDDEPIAWSCIFKSDFSTSSGYQRVVFVGYDTEHDRAYGMEFDSSAKNALHWTASYSNGSLTITSNGTNQGGYFHQPGYYQLTAVYGGEIEPTEIEVEPLSVTQNGTYTAPTGKAYSPVTVNVSGGTINVATTTWTNSSSTATTHTFTGLLGTPKAAFLRCTSSLSRSSNSSNYFVADMRWTGTATAGNSFRRSNGTFANVTSGYSFTASGTSLTVTTSGTSTSNPGSFYNGGYELTYVY